MPRPRRAKEHTGTLIGSALGAAFGGPIGGALGAAIGGAIGGLAGTAANPSEPVPLEEALTAAIAELGLVFVSLRRQSRIAATVTFRNPKAPAYFTAKGFVKPQPGLTPAVIDDALFDQIVRKIAEWRETRRVGR